MADPVDVTVSAGGRAVTVAGSGLPGYSGDGDRVVRDGRTLYVADSSCHRVRAVRLR